METKGIRRILDIYETKTKTMDTTLQTFLIDDLNKLEYHINEIIDNIYARNQQEAFAEDIEEIEKFLSYWKIHSQFDKETELKNN